MNTIKMVTLGALVALTGMQCRGASAESKIDAKTKNQQEYDLMTQKLFDARMTAKEEESSQTQKMTQKLLAARMTARQEEKKKNTKKKSIQKSCPANINTLNLPNVPMKAKDKSPDQTLLNLRRSITDNIIKRAEKTGIILDQERLENLLNSAATRNELRAALAIKEQMNALS